jgi:hypothetical protein
MRDGIQIGLAQSTMVCYFVRNGLFFGAHKAGEKMRLPLPQFYSQAVFFSELQNCVTASSARTSNNRQPGKGTTYGANI